MLQLHTDDKPIAEQWALSSIGLFIVLLRYAVRVRTVGLKGFQGDDYASVGTILFNLMYTISSHQAERNGQNMDVTVDMIPSLTDTDVSRLVYGSKMELLSWYSYSGLIWCLKLTILCFYKRLTSGSKQAKFVRHLFFFVGLAYLVVLLVTTFGCYPFNHNWQVTPMAPWSCRYRPQNLIAIAVLNAVTSVGILCIPAPMLWKLKIPLRRKLVIALSLSSAVVVICSAIIRASVTFSMEPSAENLNRWGARETLIGTLAVNVPILRLLFTKRFWRSGPYSPEDQPSRPRTGPSGAGMEEGMTLEAYEVGVRNSVDSRENIIGDRHKDKDVVVVQTTMRIEHHDRMDETTGAGDTRQHVWSNLSRSR